MKFNEIEKRIQFYKDNKKIIDSKQHNYVPFYGFDKLTKYIPGIIPGIMYKITSHMGVGKTQLAKYLFVYQPILYAIKHNINFKVLYFALEETKEEFLDNLFIHLLKRLKGIFIDKFKLSGYSTTSLTSDQLKAIEDIKLLMMNLIKNIEVIDDIYEPTNIFNKCKYYAKKWGKLVEDEEGNTVSYTPFDPSQIVLVINDHISLLEPEFDAKSNKFLTDHRTIAQWHTKICKRILTKQWNWAVLNIQQQSLESEKQQFTSKGDSIVAKILPTLDGLANNKEVARDDYVVLGLLAPERYSIENYRGYPIVHPTNINSFGDRFRSIHLLKNRLGPPNKVLPLYFDGRYNYFKELPNPTDPSIDYFYKLLKT